MSKRIITSKRKNILDNTPPPGNIRVWSYGFLKHTQRRPKNNLYAVIIGDNNKFEGI